MIDRIKLKFDGNGSSLRSQISNIFSSKGIPWNKNIWSLFSTDFIGKYDNNNIAEYAYSETADLMCPFCGHYGCSQLWSKYLTNPEDNIYKYRVPNSDDILEFELPEFIVCGSECIKLDVSLLPAIKAIKKQYPHAACHIISGRIDLATLQKSLYKEDHLYFRDDIVYENYKTELPRYNIQYVHKYATWGEFSWSVNKMIKCTFPVLKAQHKRRKIWECYTNYKNVYKDLYSFVVYGSKNK